MHRFSRLDSTEKGWIPGHEVLSITTDVLRYAPIAGLSEATHVLLNIWDAVTAVETNRLSCLRLTERCATILYSVRAEVEAASPDVADTLRDPIIKLTDHHTPILAKLPNEPEPFTARGQ